MSPPSHELELVRLSAATLEALVAGDLARASRLSGVALTPYVLEHRWLWELRLAQAAEDPAVLDWIARAALRAAGDVVGHVGFHGPPDERGMVEVAYSVDPAFRRRGYGTSMLRSALAWAAAATPAVRVVRASISPDNHGSLATLAPFGFEHVGEQWDEEDGRELLFERHVGSP